MQLKTLEKSFELGNKLEPGRKFELSRALRLQLRQIAIWFQNRRARWKTKQLGKDYDLLKSQFYALKAKNDSLLSRNKGLHAQILALKNKEPTNSIHLNKEIEESSSNRSMLLAISVLFVGRKCMLQYFLAVNTYSAGNV